MGDDATQKKRVRGDSDEEFELALPEVKRLRDDLLGLLDVSDPSTATPDLDLFMRTFQQEISASPAVDLTHKPAESELDLGYLLEASDDELGLPPPQHQQQTAFEETPEKEAVGISSRSDDIGEMWRFDEQTLSYDEFGMVGEGSSYCCEYVAVEGLFDYSESGFSTVEEPEFLWKQETLPSQLSPIPIPISIPVAASRPEIIP